MPIKQISAPAAEPVSLADAKNDMRVDADFTDHDSMIQSYLIAGRQHAETICRRAFVSQQWKMTGDRFPSPMAGRLTEYWLGQQWGLAGMGGISTFLPTGKTGYEIVIPISTLLSVESIKYTDPGGVLQTMNAADYKVDTMSEPARIVPAFGKNWPTTRQEISAVEVNFTVGYGAAAAVPEGIKAAIIMYAKAHYEAAFDDAKNNEYDRRMRAIDALLIPYRVHSFS
ncbi:MAG: head-tail connector protein [Betaproteobacteria bacterium]|nr:head-tail connector protein [Betaproteobacteria bacterium]